MRTLPNLVVSLALLLLCNSVSADTKSIQGTVIGSDGKPVANAEVSAQRLDAKAVLARTTTNALGLYVFAHLPTGAYSVTALLKGVPKSRAEVKTQARGWVKVDFDLRQNAGGKNNAAKASASPGSTGSDDLSRMQRSLGGNINNMSFPGH
jgi:Carboxypeptidase regulatory-like domain